MAKMIEEYNLKLNLDADEALEKTKELSDLISDMTPQVVIRGARDCTFNIYPSSTRISYSSKDEVEPTESEEVPQHLQNPR